MRYFTVTLLIIGYIVLTAVSLHDIHISKKTKRDFNVYSYFWILVTVILGLSIFISLNIVYW